MKFAPIISTRAPWSGEKPATAHDGTMILSGLQVYQRMELESLGQFVFTQCFQFAAR
jgi:hypothetical protein